MSREAGLFALIAGGAPAAPDTSRPMMVQSTKRPMQLTSQESLIQCGMLPPGLATQVAPKVPDQ